MVLRVTDTFGGCTSAAGVRKAQVDFLDVPPAHVFRNFVNTLARNGVTGGCGGGNYCPDAPVTRAQMAVFLLVSREGAGYAPPACVTPRFADVPCSNPYAAWINELALRGKSPAGCGGGNYCPNTAVTRDQMAVFLLVTREGAGYTPPACADPDLQRRAVLEPVLALDLRARRARDHGRMRRGELLPHGTGDPRADGRVPGHDLRPDLV